MEISYPPYYPSFSFSFSFSFIGCSVALVRLLISGSHDAKVVVVRTINSLIEGHAANALLLARHGVIEPLVQLLGSRVTTEIGTQRGIERGKVGGTQTQTQTQRERERDRER